MKKIHSISLLVFLAFIWLNPNTAVGEEGRIVKFLKEGKTWEDVLSIVNAEKKIGILYFTLKGCGPCKALEDSVFHNENAIRYIESNFVPFWIESNNEAGNALFKKFEVRGTPTLILINTSGDVLNKLIGYGGASEQYLKRLRDSANPDSSIAVLEAQSEKDPENIEAAMKYAEKLLQSGEFKKAIQHYETLKEKIADPEIYSKLAYAYERNDMEKAVEILEEGLSQNIFGDETDVIYLRLGNLLTDIRLPIELRNYKKALRYYEKIPDKAKDFSTFNKSEYEKRMIQSGLMTAQRVMPFIHIKTGEVEKGKNALNEKFSNIFAKKDLRSLGSLFYSCILHEEYSKEAALWAEKVNELSECKDYGALLFSAQILQRVGDYQKAIMIQEKLLELTKEMKRDTEWPLRDLSVMYFQAGDTKKAEKLCDELIKSAGNDFFKYWSLAEMHVRHGVNLENALKWTEKAIELSKTKHAKASEGAGHLDLFPGMIYQVYAEVLFKSGQTKKAIEVCKKAINVALDEDSKRRYQIDLDKYKASLK